ncbi:hypothetical protein [Caulobacter sp. LARHSG274]
MADPSNEPNAPPSREQRRKVSLGWILLAVAIAVIIGFLVFNANKPGAGMGGNLSGPEGSTRPAPAGNSG